MKKTSIAAVLFCVSVSSIAAVPDGKIEKPFVIGNEVICLKEIQKQMTPFLKLFEQENGVKYKFNVKSGLSYKDTVGLRLEVSRVDSELNVKIADLEYYWLQERGNMCQPAYMVLDRSGNV
ncbi:hypothetical protein ODT90_04105 [Escherichia coli]|uniref:hypothetical protein n=1 Tax=Escherichia coli TaxID=562 RepID=UPI001EDD9A86|nr:hypothetical protein [Escherichia coli]EGI6880738.1 hypothetical protein [Escherichia coli]MCG3992106.1 hypothetical protein [Escherichia coli]MCV1141294.1 hypothetical protein [Escherichia coli]MCV8790288.1 hypothetical protein [Escherichia coli]MDC8811212.1 hypothetical protein [Escherichia coli]